ncbi:hypothetical protein [Salinispora pacifica]|uniref:hypothetical protein n=1 Tax=Salinispora pacifica TaxID=351187 RepID=UPI001EE39EBA|nr:hypothetical protein [Salinispora pacifica]
MKCRVLGMYCVYEWDAHRDLVKVTAADGFGLRWCQVMNWAEWQRVADQAATAGQLDLLAFRALVLRVLEGEWSGPRPAGVPGAKSTAGRRAAHRPSGAGRRRR